MSRKYKIITKKAKDEKGNLIWLATFPDILGLLGAGETKEEAVRELEIAKNLYLDYLEKNKEPFPKRRL